MDLYSLPMMQRDARPIVLNTVPLLSLHSMIVPLIVEDTFAMAVELSKPFEPISVTLWNWKGPHESVKMGGLWSIVSAQLTGSLNIHRVIPLARLSWLQLMVTELSVQVVMTPSIVDGIDLKSLIALLHRIWVQRTCKIKFNYTLGEMSPDHTVKNLIL